MGFFVFNWEKTCKISFTNNSHPDFMGLLFFIFLVFDGIFKWYANYLSFPIYLSYFPFIRRCYINIRHHNRHFLPLRFSEQGNT